MDRGLPGAARARALLQPRRRPLRPAPRHPPEHRASPRRPTTRARAPGSSRPTPATRSRPRFVVMATGCLSAPNVPDVPGIETFRGAVVQTSRWPEDGVELAGKRIGLDRHRLVGRAGDARARGGRRATSTCSSARRRSRGRRATGRSTAEVQADDRSAGYPELREQQRESFGGVTAIDRRDHPSACRGDRKILETHRGGAPRGARRSAASSAVASGATSATDLDANEIACELYREMVRRTVHDPDARRVAVAAGLPDRLQAAGHRLELLRDVQPRQRHARRPAHGRHRVASTETGIQTGAGPLRRSTCIVFATGFDAMTGALLAHRHPRPRRRARSATTWADGPRTLPRAADRRLPEPVHGDRDRGSPSVLANMVVCSRAARRVDRRRASRTSASTATPRSRPTAEAQDAWVEHVNAARAGHDVHRPDAATPGTSAPTSRASRACSCRTSAASRRTSRRPRRSPPPATRASHSTEHRRGVRGN